MRGSQARSRTVVGAVAATAACAVLLAGSPACPVTQSVTQDVTHGTRTRAAVEDRSLSELLTELKTRYRKADAASAAYRRTVKKLRAQRERAERLERRRDRTRSDLAEQRRAAGRLARGQYRTGAMDLPPAVRVLLADDPVVAARYGHTLERIAGRRDATLRALASTERHRGAAAAKARRATERAKELAERTGRRREAARARLRDVERLLASVSERQLAQLRELDIVPSSPARDPQSPGRLETLPR